MTLVKVRGSEQLRAEGGEEVDRQRADEHGSVTFPGAQIGAQYPAVGRLGHHPIEVRARGVQPDDAAVVQPPVAPDRAWQRRAARRGPTAETRAWRRRTSTVTFSLDALPPSSG